MSASVVDLLEAATGLHALTLHQPWAYAVGELGKDVENRGWEPPQSLLGRPLAIHAGLTWDASGATSIQEALGLRVPGRQSCTRGAVVAVARLARVVRGSSSRWAVQGQRHWCLEGAVRLPQPVACKGAQGLWSLPPGVFLQVREQLLQDRAHARAARALSPTEGSPTGLEKAATEAGAATRASLRTWAKGSARGAGPSASTGTVYVQRGPGVRVCEWCGNSRPNDASPHAPRLAFGAQAGWPACAHGQLFLEDCAGMPVAPGCCRPAWAACGGPLLSERVPAQEAAP